MKTRERESTGNPDAGILLDTLVKSIYLAVTTQGNGYPRYPIERTPDLSPQFWVSGWGGKKAFYAPHDDVFGPDVLSYIENRVMQAKAQAMRRMGQDWKEPVRRGSRPSRYGPAHINELFAELALDLDRSGRQQEYLTRLGLDKRTLELARQITLLDPDFDHPSAQLVQLFQQK